MAQRGRPKKIQEIVDETNQLIARSQEETQKLAEVREQVQQDIKYPPKETSLNDIFLSITRNPVNQRWMVLQMKYDYKTQTFGPIEKIEESLERADVLHRFQVLSGHAFFGES